MTMTNCKCIDCLSCVFFYNLIQQITLITVYNSGVTVKERNARESVIPRERLNQESSFSLQKLLLLVKIFFC